MARNSELSVVRVANTPTEAQLLKNALEAVEIPAYINDANLLQANDFLTGAVGGVKVLVASFDIERAQQVLREWDQGAFVLEGETMDAPPEFKTLERPVFSPDAATLWSLLLTPAFAAAVEILNLQLMKRKEGWLQAWIYFALMFGLSIWGIVFLFHAKPSFLSPLLASIGLSAITIISYFISGKQQTAYLIREYGLHYARRPMLLVAILVGLAMAAVSGLATLIWDL